MQLQGYCVATMNEDGSPSGFYDGNGYQDNPEKMRIFAKGEIDLARYEQANHQRLRANIEVRVLPLNVDIPGVEMVTPELETLPPVPNTK